MTTPLLGADTPAWAGSFRSWPPAIYRLLLLSFALLGPGGSLASVDSGHDVLFAGFAVTGSAADTDTTLPYAFNIIEDLGLVELNRRLRGAISEVPEGELHFLYDSLGRLDGTTGTLGMAVSLDRETTLVDQIGEDYRLLYELSAQLLFFDFDDLQLRTSYPIIIQRVDALPESPTDADIERLARQALTETSESGLIRVAADRLSTLRLPSPASRTLQIVDVSLSDPDSAPPRVTDLLRSGVLGHELSKVLSGTAGIGLIPHRRGQAVGGAIAARFADGRIYNIRLPDPDYELDVDVRGFSHRVLRQTPGFRQDLLGAYFDLTATEPVSGRRLIDGAFRHGVTKTIPASQSGYDEGAALYEALISGFASLVTAAVDGEREWIRQQAEPRTAADSADALEQLLEYCR